MKRHLLTFLAALSFSCGSALWAEDPAPAAAPAPAATAPAPAPAEIKPAEAAPTAAVDMTPAEKAEKHIRASKEWFGFTYKPYDDADKKAWADAEAKLKAKPDDADAKAVMDAKATADAIAYKTKDEKEIAPATAVSSGDNAWMLISSALVLLMTAPGLALFYGGLVRRKNVLGTMMQSFAMVGIVTVIWTIFGFSLAFGDGNSFFGNFSQYLFLKDVVWSDTLWTGSQRYPISGDYAPTISFGSFAMFQLMFAIITPALIAGAYAERMKFAGMVLFNTLWLVLIYCPMAHMVWGKGGYFNWGFGAIDTAAFDFAGGTVVHISSGIAALVCAIMLGKRKGYPDSPMPPHSLVLSFIGASLLWVGWFGFNAGSALGAGGLATLAFANTQVATAAAALSWPLAEWILRGKPTVLGAISGAVAGLVAITPACGFVTPGSALIIGLVAGALCMTTASYMKRALGYDDSLDAFGVHCIGGIWGAIATGIFLNVESNPCIAALNDALYRKIVIDHHSMVFNQIKAVGITVILSGIGSVIIFAIVKFTVGVRVTADEESEGLDISQHGEEAYNS